MSLTRKQRITKRELARISDEIACANTDGESLLWHLCEEWDTSLFGIDENQLILSYGLNVHIIERGFDEPQDTIKRVHAVLQEVIRSAGTSEVKSSDVDSQLQSCREEIIPLLDEIITYLSESPDAETISLWKFTLLKDATACFDGRAEVQWSRYPADDCIVCIEQYMQRHGDVCNGKLATFLSKWKSYEKKKNMYEVRKRFTFVSAVQREMMKRFPREVSLLSEGITDIKRRADICHKVLAMIRHDGFGNIFKRVQNVLAAYPQFVYTDYDVYKIVNSCYFYSM
jgi:hypothetical protein